jgi:hypothetical protein
VILPNDTAPSQAKKMMTATDGLDRPFLARLQTDLGEAGFAELCHVACSEVTALAAQLRAALATTDRARIVTTARQLQETAAAMGGAGLAAKAAQIVALAERDAINPGTPMRAGLTAEVAAFLAALSAAAGRLPAA